MIAAVETYLAVRRLGGFALSNTEYLLRSFAAYAGAHGEAVVRTATVITWASQGPSLAQRHRRYETVRQFAAAEGKPVVAGGVRPYNRRR